MGKSKGERRRAQWAAREAAYQEAVNARARQQSNAAPVERVEPSPAPATGEPKTKKPGTQRAGTQRAGREKAGREKRPAAQLPDVRPREVACPRCLARVGAPCRNGRGEPAGAHADRKREAAEKGRRTPRRVIERGQLQRYLADAAEPVAGQGRNRADELFAARRHAATTRSRTADRQRRTDGL